VAWRARITSSWSGPSYGVRCVPHVRHFIVHTRRAGQVVTRPLNCGVMRSFRGGAFLLTRVRVLPMPFDLAELYVQEAESLLGARFPDSYRRAMMQSNGGEVEAAGDVWELIPIRDSSSQKRLSRTCNDVLSETDQFRLWRSWPKRAIGIARNGVGDALVLLRDGEEIQSAIHAWWHETGQLEFVANDFGDLPSA
jgi:hypothetical protein